MQKKWFLLCMGLFAIPTYANENAAQNLIATLEKIKSFQAHFDQKIKDTHGEHLTRSQGEILIERPLRFYWKSQKPDPILIIADGKFLWTYDIDLEQVTKQELKGALRNSPATLLAGDISQIHEDFNISFAKEKQCNKDTTHCYLLRPKKEAAFSDIVIGFTNEKITEIKMRDPLGQDVTTRFSQVKNNPTINKQRFSFVPPKGVDVIEAER